jgi:nicotinamidase/pyrazinamidase
MKVLLLVDIQNDFLPGGALAVTDGDQIIPVVNQLIPKFELIVATQDWHPQEHGSFASNHSSRKPGELIQLSGLTQVLWPDHCVQNTFGAAFSQSLNTNSINTVFRKGADVGVDSYSGFFDNGKRNDTGLHDYLQRKGVEEVFIVGLATDYCVKFTAIDSAALGYKTRVVADATRAVNLLANDGDEALAEMKEQNIELLHSSDLFS